MHGPSAAGRSASARKSAYIVSMHILVIMQAEAFSVYLHFRPLLIMLHWLVGIRRGSLSHSKAARNLYRNQPETVMRRDPTQMRPSLEAQQWLRKGKS